MKYGQLEMDEIPKGTLVEIVPGPKTMYEEGVGVVLEWCSSNVYEPASCDVLVEGEVLHVSTRKINMIKENQND